jgi:hypothetical protein
MFGECWRKPIILNAWFELWNVEVNPWWFRKQYHGIFLVLKLLWMIELLAVTTWTFYLTGCYIWSSCCLLTMTRFFKITTGPYTHQKCSVLVWGAWRCTSTSSLASTITRIKYHQTTVVSSREYGKKKIPSSIISQATRRRSSRRVVQYSTRDYSQLIWIYCKKDTSCIQKMWPNSILIKKYVSFTTVSITLSIPGNFSL